MIESKWKHDADYKKYREHQLIVIAEYRNTDQVEHHDRHLSSHDVRQNCANKKAFLAFEDRAARRATISDLKRTLDD